MLILLLLAITYRLPGVLAGAMPWPALLRVSLSVLCLAPLGVLLGLPLPMAVARLGTQSGVLIPLAWGINGGASVLASVLAMLISINWGLKATLVAGVLCYSAAWMLWPMLARFSAAQAGGNA